MTVEFVDWEEPTTYEIARILLRKGYEPADFEGMSISPADKVFGSTRQIGIVKSRPQKIKKILFWERKVTQRGFFIAQICLVGNRRLGADSNNWVMEVYGKRFVDEMRELAEELAETFSVNVKVVLEDPNPRYELYWQDLMAAG